MKTINKILATSSITAVIGVMVILAPLVSAATMTIGNDSNSRTQLDTASNFTVIDTNHMVTTPGQITSFGYFVPNTNPFSFVVVDNQNMVKYISSLITPVAVGVNTFTPVSPVQVVAGDNIGVYFSTTGTIPFENTGTSAIWTANNSGIPTVGVALTQAGSAPRTYSIFANETTTETPVLTSLTVSPSTATITAGATQQLTASPMDQNSVAFTGATLTYASSDTSVATVSSSGMVTAIASGSATITVTAMSGNTSVTGTSVVTVNSESNNNGNGKGGNFRNNNFAAALSIRLQVLENQLKALISEINDLISRFDSM